LDSSSSGDRRKMRRIKVSFEDSEFEELRRLAEEKGSPYSQFIREAVRRMLEQEREREEKEREAFEKVEAIAEECMLRTVKALELLRDEVGLMGSGLQEVKEKLSAMAQGSAARDRALEELREELRAVEGAVTRLEGTIGLLREELSELRKRVATMELSAREGRRREEGVMARRESEAGHGRLHREEAGAIAISSEAVAAGPDADFQVPSFIKDNPWVEILSRKGRP
jgi:metal-responsive CopG/Arc/MetJ family transcriptional regulator